ncbi:MAG: tetratricopeptide repeat protein [Candidatus Aureabacteria bacterium]|nr:tetratricopeptide repeat protein [Candidatus Auribacterota bacterium]
MDTEGKTEWKFYFHHLHLILAVAAIFCLAVTQILGLDIWWHLAVGKYLLRTRAFPSRDVFSFTGGAWDNKEWLFGILVYLIHRVGGVNLLTLAKAALFTATFVVLMVLSVRRSSNRYISLCIVLLAAFACRFRLSFRPELVSFLFIALLLLFLDAYLRGKRMPLCFFPLIMLLWVNIHPLAFLGLAILLIYIVGDLVSRLLREQADKNGWRVLGGGEFSLLLLIFAASCIAFICNPISVHRFLSPYELLTKHSAFLSTITETKPLPVLQFPSFAAVLLLAVFTLVMFVTSMEPADTMLLICFGLLSVTMARNAPLLPICAAPVIASQIAGLFSALPGGAFTFLSRWKKSADIVIAVLLAGLIVWACLMPDFGLGYGGLLYPEGAVKYVIQNSPRARMFNIYDWGGFLIWNLYPRYKVSMDGRGPDAYNPEVWAEYETVELGREGWERVLDKYDVNFVLISTGNKLFDLIARINESPVWRLAYWDFQSMVFLRDIPAHTPLINAYEYKALNTETQDFRYFVPQLEIQIMSELYNFLKTHPDSLGGRNLLAVSYLRKGQVDQAIKEFEKVLEFHPRTPKLHYNLGMLYSQKGDEKKAFDEYEKEIALDPEFPAANNNAGRILYEKGDLTRAEKYFKKAVKSDPRYYLAMNNLGLIYMDEGRYTDAIAEFKKCLEIEPKYQGALQNLSLAEEMLAHPAETHNRLGQIYYSQNNLQKAEQNFKKALESNPKYTVAMGNLGVVCLKKGQYEEAARKFKEVLSISPDDAAARQHLAIAEEMLKRPESARRD